MPDIKSESIQRRSRSFTHNVRKSVLLIRQLSGPLSPNGRKIRSAEKDLDVLVRLDLNKRKKGESVICVQKVVRGYLSRKITLCLITENRACRIIQKHLAQYHHKCASERRLETIKKMHCAAIHIQTRTRLVLSKAYAENTRQQIRLNAEQKLEMKRYEVLCHERLSSIMLLKSIKCSLKYDGIMQTLFNHWSSSFDKLDCSSLVKCLREAPGVFCEKNKSKRLSIGVTDIDLIFVKISKGLKFVSFRQFLEILENISAAIFGHVKECRGYSGKDGRWMELMFNHIFLTKSGKFFGNILQKRTSSLLKKSAQKIQNLYRCHHLFQSAVQKLKEKKRLSIKRNISCHSSKESNNEEEKNLVPTDEWFTLHCAKCHTILARCDNSYCGIALCMGCFKNKS